MDFDRLFRLFPEAVEVLFQSSDQLVQFAQLRGAYIMAALDTLAKHGRSNVKVVSELLKASTEEQLKTIYSCNTSDRAVYTQAPRVADSFSL